MQSAPSGDREARAAGSQGSALAGEGGATTALADWDLRLAALSDVPAGMRPARRWGAFDYYDGLIFEVRRRRSA